MEMEMQWKRMLVALCLCALRKGSRERSGVQGSLRRPGGDHGEVDGVHDAGRGT